MSRHAESADKKPDQQAAGQARTPTEDRAVPETGLLPELGASATPTREAPQAISPRQALYLQRKVGNRSVSRLVAEQRRRDSSGSAPGALVQREGEEVETLLAGKATPDAVKSESDVFDSVSSTKTKSESRTFTGSQAVKKTGSLSDEMKKLSPKQVEDTIEYMARTGAFGESAREAAYERGGFSAKASGKAEGSAGAKADLKAGLEVSYDAFETMKAFVEASAQVGLAGTVQGAAEVALGPAALEVKGQIDALVGAMVKATGKATFGAFKVALEGSAEAFAGAKVSGEGSVTFKIADLAATGTVKGEALAGAGAAAKGEFSIGLSGVTAAASAEAFAGAKASATGQTTLSLKGVTIVSAKGTVEVSAGVGGKAKGEFKFEMGKLKIAGGLAASLGIGTGAEVEIEIDFIALGDAMQKVIIAAFYKKKEEVNRASPAAERVPLIDEELIMKYRKLGYDTFFRDFEAYALRLSKSKGPVTREAVQKILDNRYNKIKEAYLFLETDEGIKLAVTATLFKSGLEEIEIQAGQIRQFKAAGSEAFSTEKVKKLF